ncbi:MAG: hypothetical protein Q8Q23_04425 [bacterium]|nr:hypothetical protein [bacterium]
MARKLGIIFLILVIIVLLSGCQKKVNTGESFITPKQKDTEQVPIGDLAKWQTLKRESENFVIKYPQSWYWQRDWDGETPETSFFLGLAPSQETLGKGANYPVEFLITTDGSEWGYDGYLRTFMIRDDARYVLRGGRQYRDIINAMIDSFKFLDENVDITSWPVYRNDQYGFEFKYPSQVKIYEDKKDGAVFYLEFCGEISCFVSPDFLKIETTQSTDVAEILYNYDKRGRGPNNEGGLAADRIAKREITLGGKKALLTTVNYGDWYWLQVIDGGNLISIVIDNWTDTYFQDGIASSFKFIEN